MRPMQRPDHVFHHLLHADAHISDSSHRPGARLLWDLDVRKKIVSRPLPLTVGPASCRTMPDIGAADEVPQEQNF